MSDPVTLDLVLVDRMKNGAIMVAREGVDPADGVFLWPKDHLEPYDASVTRVRVRIDAGLARLRGLA